MKIILALLIAVTTLQQLQATENLISCSFRLQNAKDLLTSPKAIVLPGTSFEIAVTRDHVQEPEFLLPLGVILRGKTNWIDGEIRYLFVLTIRDSANDSEKPDGAKVATFKTEEYLLSGKATAGESIPIKLADGKMITLELSPSKKEAKDND